MAAMKLSNIICVVDRLNFIFFIVDQFLDIKKAKGTHDPFRQLAPITFIKLYHFNILLSSIYSKLIKAICQ